MEKVGNRKRILFVVQLPPPVHGASVMNQTILKSQLINTRFDCTYINLSTSIDLSDIGKNSIKKYIRLIKLYMHILFTLFKNDYDLCYITLVPSGIGFIKDSIVVLIVKLFRKKIVFHFHGKGMKEYYLTSNKLLRKYIQFIFRDIYVIHLSEILLDDLKNINLKKHKFVLPNGILPIEQKVIKDIEQNDMVMFLFLSNMIKTKGVLVLLEAIAKLKEKTAKFHVTFIGQFGNKNFKKDFFSYIETQNLNNFVTYLGPKYDKEKYQALMENDVFIFPTMNDAFPLVLLEAMQFHLPIISTFEGAIPEIITNAREGFLIEKDNVIQLSEKMRLFLEKPSLIERMGKKGREKYLNEFTVEKFERKLINILENVINKN